MIWKLRVTLDSERNSWWWNYLFCRDEGGGNGDVYRSVFWFEKFKYLKFAKSRRSWFNIKLVLRLADFLLQVHYCICLCRFWGIFLARQYKRVSQIHCSDNSWLHGAALPGITKICSSSFVQHFQNHNQLQQTDLENIKSKSCLKEDKDLWMSWLYNIKYCYTTGILVL